MGWVEAHKHIMQSSHSLLTFPLHPLPMLLQAIVLSRLVSASLFRHLSGWQVRSLAPRSHALKQSLLRRLSFKKPHPLPFSCQEKVPEGRMRCASPASLQGCHHCVSIHRRLQPITFATPQQHTCMAASIIACAPFFGSPDTFSHTSFVTVSGKHENPRYIMPSAIQVSC